jgi:DNA polymerase III delta prime subunit
MKNQNTNLTTEKVIDKIEEMCQVLRTNYQSYSIARHRDYIAKGDSVEWHQEQIDKLCEGEGVDEYTYTKGKKYAKIIHVTSDSKQRSAHAFVDMNTGDVYKSATWSAPALNGVRYNLLDDQSRQDMYKRADWAGSYLYK